MSVIRLQGDNERRNKVYYEVDPASVPLGVGGMGRVYKGIMVNEKTRATRPVAIKFMYEDSSPETINRARREASMRFRSDSLVEMLGFIETHDKMDDGSAVVHYHVISELLRGVTLSDAIQGQLTDFEGKEVDFAVELMQLYHTRRDIFAARIVKSVLAGLMTLHDAGYIHRDIDPSNIMLTSDRQIKLIDFGIARKVENLSAERTEVGDYRGERLFGKPAYAAPELIRGEVNLQNVTTDTYAVGILLYQLVCGQLPFSGDMNQIMQKQLSENVPVGNIGYAWLQEVVKRATEKQQGKRFQSASEFRVAIDNASKAASKFPLGRRSTSNVVTTKMIVLVMAFCLLGLTFGIVMALLL